MSEFAWFVAAVLGAFAVGVIVGVALAEVEDDPDPLLRDVAEPPSNVTIVDQERWSRNPTVMREYRQRQADLYDWERDGG